MGILGKHGGSGYRCSDEDRRDPLGDAHLGRDCKRAQSIGREETEDLPSCNIAALSRLIDLAMDSPFRARSLCYGPIRLPRIGESSFLP